MDALQISTATVVILVVVAFAAGWVDAVVGGGGLLLLPALMVTAPGLPVATVLGTNKLAAIMGTSSAAVTYSRHTRPDGRVTLPAALLAVAGAGAGAACFSSCPSRSACARAAGARVSSAPSSGRRVA